MLSYSVPYAKRLSLDLRNATSRSVISVFCRFTNDETTAFHSPILLHMQRLECTQLYIPTSNRGLYSAGTRARRQGRDFGFFRAGLHSTQKHNTSRWEERATRRRSKTRTPVTSITYAEQTPGWHALRVLQAHDGQKLWCKHVSMLTCESKRKKYNYLRCAHHTGRHCPIEGQQKCHKFGEALHQLQFQVHVGSHRLRHQAHTSLTGRNGSGEDSKSILYPISYRTPVRGLL